MEREKGKMIDWKKCTASPPPEGLLLLTCGDSGYTPRDQFLALAYHDSEYRPPIDGRIRWLGVTGDALADHGWHPSHWAFIPKGFLPNQIETDNSWKMRP